MYYYYYYNYYNYSVSRSVEHHCCSR